MRHRLLIVLLLCLLAATTLFMWLRMAGGVSDFGLNAFTETFGILVTVLIVDHLIRRQEELRSLPQKAAAYEDVRLLVSRIVSFWSDVYRASVPEASPASVRELFSEPAFEKMQRFLNMDAQPNVTPATTWWDWVPRSLADHRQRGETILERHNNVLDPNAYGLVHQIATEGIDPNLIRSIKQSDDQMGFPRPHVLGSYWFLPETYCDAVVGLVDWCESQFEMLGKNGVKNLKNVGKVVGPWARQERPPSMISDDELSRQLAAVAVFRQRHAAQQPL